MLKLHNMLIFAGVTQNHGDSRKSRHMTNITAKATTALKVH